VTTADVSETDTMDTGRSDEHGDERKLADVSPTALAVFQFETERGETSCLRAGRSAKRRANVLRAMSLRQPFARVATGGPRPAGALALTDANAIRFATKARGGRLPQTTS
jgi:hypothetical protein